MNYFGNNRRALLRHYGGDVVEIVKDPQKFFTKNYQKFMAPTKRKHNATSVYISPPRTPKRKTLTGPVTIRPISIKKKPKRQVRTPRKTVWKVGSKVQAKAKRPNRLTGHSVGSYQGNFANPVAVQKSFETTGLKLGYVVAQEITGSVDDPDCVYLYHSPFQVDKTVQAIVGALIRTLLRKAGIEVGNEMNELLFNTYDNALGATILFTFQDLTGVTTSYYVETFNDWTFEFLVATAAQVVGPSNIGYHFKQFILGLSEFKPYSMSLYMEDKFGVTPEAKTSRLAAHVTLGDEYVVLRQYSCLTLQNRTKASNATGFEMDRIDSQPLTGKLYEFKNGDPRLKTAQRIGTGIIDQHEQVYSTGDIKGVRAWGSVDLPSAYLMREPPDPTLWRNIAKSSSIKLEPGAMKKCVLTVEYKYRLPTLMSKLRVDSFKNSNNMLSYEGLHSGKCQIIALEEQLATPADNFITCQYEYENKTSCYTYTKKLKGTLKTLMEKGTNTQWQPPL